MIMSIPFVGRARCLTCSASATRLSSADGGLLGVSPAVQRAAPPTPGAVRARPSARRRARTGVSFVDQVRQLVVRTPGHRTHARTRSTGPADRFEDLEPSGRLGAPLDDARSPRALEE